jgi:putative iron-dependent peroxidase
MAHPQYGIFDEDDPFNHCLEYALKPDAKVDAVRAALAELAEPKCQEVTAFGPAFWRQLNPQSMPDRFDDFKPLAGPQGHTAPSTQGDIMVWIHGPDTSDVFDAALAVHWALNPHCETVVDQSGFTYHDSRDLIGFVDGSANPIEEQARAAALIPDGQIGAGGSFVLTQRWVHDLPKFASKTIKEQEGIVGRTKEESIELEGDAMPVNSHVSRTDVSVDGVAQKIYRRSFPYGNVREHGLFFLAFSCQQSRFEIQLERMYGLTEDGVSDRILEFSRAVTGAYWYAPSQEDLFESLQST